MMLTSRPTVASHLMRTSRSSRCVSLKLVRNRTLATDSSTLLRSPQENNPVQRGISVSTRAVDSQTPGSRPAKKKSKKLVDINGDVVKDLGNGMFAVKLENGVSVMSHLSGKIRQNKIKVVTGDKVTVELSPYDLTRGRLTYRFKPGEYEKMLAGESEDEQQ